MFLGAAIRTQDNAIFRGSLLSLLNSLIIEYTGADITPTPVGYDERGNAVFSQVGAACVDLIFEKFGWIGYDEIAQAFQLASVGDLRFEEKPIDLTAWGGKFTVSSFAKIMKGYSDWRDVAKKAAGEVDAALSAKLESEETEQRNEATRAAVVAEFESLKANADQLRGFFDVRDYWEWEIKILQQQGLIESGRQDLWQYAIGFVNSPEFSIFPKPRFQIDNSPEITAYSKMLVFEAVTGKPVLQTN